MTEATLTPKLTLKHEHGVWSATRTRDGAIVITAAGKLRGPGQVRVWRASNGRNFAGSELGGEVAAVVLSPDESCFCSCDKSGEARLWDVPGCRPLFPPWRHRKEVWDAEFHPSEPWIATASADKTVRLWNWRTGREAFEPFAFPREVWRVSFSSDGRRLVAVCRGRRIGVVSFGRIAPQCRWLEHPARVLSAQFTSDGQQLLTACDDRWLRVWDAAGNQPAEQLVRVEKGWIGGLAVSADGDSIFGEVSFHSMKEHWGDLFRWNRLDRQFDFRKRPHTFHPNSVTLSRDERLLLSASGDMTARLHDARSGDTLATMRHEAHVMGASFDHAEESILTWSLDGTARLWDIKRIARAVRRQR